MRQPAAFGGMMARRQNFDRRTFLRHLAGGAAALGGAVAARAQDLTLEQLIEQTQRGEYGQGFDSASRTILMPKSTWPTLSPATVQLTQKAIERYDGIVASGGWPTVPPSERLRVGNRHPSVTALRQRLIAAGDLSAKAGTTDIFDSYVEAAVRRFQARHGLTVDGILREPTFQALNVPAAVRLAQLKTNLVRLPRQHVTPG